MHKYLWAIRQQCESNRQTKPIIIIEISKIKTTSRVCFVHVEHEYEQASHMLQCVSVSSVQSETLGREWRNIHMHHSSGIFRLLSLTFQFQSIIITGKNNKKNYAGIIFSFALSPFVCTYSAQSCKDDGICRSKCIYSFQTEQ